MVARDHSCTYPFCIQPAPKTCPDCGNWLCVKHLQNHSCKKVDTWQANAASLNALRPSKVKVNFDPTELVDKVPRVGVPEPPRKPSRKDWRDTIGR